MKYVSGVDYYKEPYRLRGFHRPVIKTYHYKRNSDYRGIAFVELAGPYIINLERDVVSNLSEALYGVHWLRENFQRKRSSNIAFDI